MFFKFVEYLLFSPYPFWVAFLFVLYSTFKKGYKDRILWFGLVLGGLCLLSTNGLVYAVFSAPLKWSLPDNSTLSADAIVVLGSSAQKNGAPTDGSAERAYEGAEAFLTGQAPIVLLTGFSEHDSLGSAKSMAIVVLGMGVSRDKVLMTGGRNSYEEAVFGGDILHQRDVHKIILVTSWYHIPRAKLVWEKQGFDVVTRTYIPDQKWNMLFKWEHMFMMHRVCHEYAGMLVYKFRGWI